MDERAWKLGDDLSTCDNLLDGITFDELILTVHCNCKYLTPAMVWNELRQILAIRKQDSVSGSYFRKKDRPYACNVLFVGLNQSSSGGFVNVEYEKSGYQFQLDFDQFGKAVFPSRDEAKSELSEVSDDVLQP